MWPPVSPDSLVHSLLVAEHLAALAVLVGGLVRLRLASRVRVPPLVVVSFPLFWAASAALHLGLAVDPPAGFRLILYVMAAVVPLKVLGWVVLFRWLVALTGPRSVLLPHPEPTTATGLEAARSRLSRTMGRLI